MSKFKHMKKYYQGTMEGKPVSERDDGMTMLTRPKEKLSENDFTKPGEMIPKDAGLMDFMNYNVAHADPTSDENLMNMAFGAGSLAKVGAKGAGQALKFIPGMHLEAKAKDFSKAIQQAMEHSPLHKQNITPYAEQEYKTFKTFLAPDHKSGFAIKPDGELVNVFSTEKGRGKGLVQDAVKQGASKLDAFNIDNKLPSLYKNGGFETHKIEKNWTPGGPDVNYMALPEKHPELFPERANSVDAKEEALSKLAGKNEFGYRPERPIKHIPDAPESLTRSLEDTPVVKSNPDVMKQADINEQALNRIKEQQGDADRVIGNYDSYGSGEGSGKPDAGVGKLTAMDNYVKTPEQNLDIPSAMPDRSEFLTADDHAKLIEEMIKNRRIP